MAITADGKIGVDKNHLANWTSKEDKQHFSNLTKEAGVLIFGRNTFSTINRSLPGRKIIVLTNTPEKYQNIPGEVEYKKATTGKDILDELASQGYQKVILGGGAAINEFFLEKNLVDEIYITIEPLLFGRGLGIAENTQLKTRLKLLNIDRINQDSVVLHYEVLR